MDKLEKDGYQIIRNIFDTTEVERLRKEADKVAQIEGSACVRRLRDKSECFSLLATSRCLLDLLPANFLPVRSILFDKTAHENWPVAWHQDLTISVKQKVEIQDYGPWSIKDGITHVQPPEELLRKMLTIRIHLDDTPTTNGALRVIPKSHLKGKIPTSDVRQHTHLPALTCCCKAGDILMMSPLLLHASSKAQNPDRRRIIHFEYATLDALDKRLIWYEHHASHEKLL